MISTTAQFNTSGFSGSVSTYFTIGTSDSPIITIFFGQEIILKMQKEKTFTFVFVLQVRSSGTVTQTFSSMASLIALTGIRQDTPDIRAEVNEEGTDTTTFVSALDRVNKTSTSNNTECLYTMELILQKIQFTNAVTGELYPCDLDNQENAEPPYVEIRDKYNNTHIKRYCYLDRNESIHSFGDQMFGYIVTNGDPNIVPDIRAIQIKEEYCCGGVFYGAFREPLIIPSPDYPQYKPHMRCPFVFRCDEDFEDCVIRLEFESFNLASNDLSRSRRQALNESDFGNGTDATTLAPYVPPTGSDFNRTICAGEDVVRVSQCDSISAINGREFCADNPPSQVYTGYKEVLLYFDSNDERQDQGFVIKFTAKDRRKWIYSDAELNPQCTCAHNLPNQIRKYFRKRNKSKANKAKANNESLRRVRREERENLKERRMAEREGRIPERKRGKMKPQNDGNRDKSDKDKDEKREKDVEGPKSRKMKPQNGGNRDKSDKDKDEKREKDVEGTKSRKMKPQNGGNRDRSDKDKDEKREKDVDGPKRRRMKKMRKTEGGGKNDEDQNKGKNGRDKEEKDDEKPKKRRNRMKAGGKDKDAENQNKKNKDRESKDNANGPKRQRENGGRGSEENAERRKRKRKKTGNSDEGRNENEPKKLEKDRRKDRLQENKAQRLQRKNKNEDEDMPMSRALNARTNRKRQQFPWLVSVVQYELPLVGDKVKDDRKIERLCGGTLLSDRYILTTTSCCTYCKFLWEKKNKKNNSRKKRDAEGEGNNMTNKRRRNKGEAKKGEVKEGEDMDTEKKDNKRKRRKNKKTDDEEGGKNRNRDREEERRNQRKAERKERRNRKNGSEGDDDKKKDKKNGNENNNDRNKRQRNRNRTQKGGKKEDKENGNNRTKKGGKKDKENEREDTNRKNPNPRQKTKKRDPFKKDVAAIIGEGRISINKLGDIQPQKIARIFIPSDCYDKMGKTELNGEPLYPVECPVILKLKKKQKFNRFIKPMCLPIFDKIKINKERAASMGYGIRKSTKREPSKIPAEVINMRVLKKCEKRLKMKLDKTMICTKGKKERTHVLLRRRFAALECQSNWRWIQAACQPLRCLGCAKLRT
nr:uncharacterized protein LOC113816921 [Penaeus vannamei]